MKKILTTMAMAGVACGAFAQGTLLFDNNNSGVITLNVSQTGPTAKSVGDVGSNPGGAVWNVALLYNSSSTSLSLDPKTGFTGTAVADYIPNASNPSDTAGSFQDTAAGKEVVITVPFITQQSFEVVSWLGSATTWAQALTTASYTGASSEFLYTPANPAITPSPPPPGSVNGSEVGSWDGNLVLVPVPEPTTIALGGIGAAALMLFRRRK